MKIETKRKWSTFVWPPLNQTLITPPPLFVKPTKKRIIQISIQKNLKLWQAIKKNLLCTCVQTKHFMTLHCIAMHCNVRLLCIKYATLLKKALSMIKIYYYPVLWSFDMKCSEMHWHKNNVLLLRTNVTHCSKNALSIIKFRYYFSL